MDIQTIIEGGAVGIALFAVHLNYKLVSNHISHSIKTQTELKDAIHELIRFLKRNGIKK